VKAQPVALVAVQSSPDPRATLAQGDLHMVPSRPPLFLECFGFFDVDNGAPRAQAARRGGLRRAS
jgi:hypothetical protein